MRIGKDEEPVHYTATSFVEPFEGCRLTLRRMEASGMLEPRTEGQLQGLRFVDVLDEIVDTIGVTQRGFEYLRSKLGFRRESAVHA